MTEIRLIPHLVGGEGKAGVLVQGDRHRRGAGEADRRFIDRKTGVRVHDLGAWLAEHQAGEEHGRLAARLDHDVFGVDGDAAVGLDVLGHRQAQFGDAVGRGVAVVAVGQGLAAGLDDVLGRLEVRLADPEVDDAAALGGQRIGPGQHLEGGLGAQVAHAFGELHAGVMARPGPGSKPGSLAVLVIPLPQGLAGDHQLELRGHDLFPGTGTKDRVPVAHTFHN